MQQPLRILHLEDDRRDADMVRDVLEAGGIVCSIELVRTRDDFVAALDAGAFDLILADHSLPSFDGMSALRIVVERASHVPFIFVSGTLGEEVAIEALKLGAMDYVVKERMSRIVSAVRNALREAEYRVERKDADDQLRASEARFRTFVDHARDAFFLMDEELEVIDVNRQACESLGYAREELIGTHPRDFDVSLDEASIDRLAQRASAGEIITFETRHRRKDGTTFPVEIRTGTFRQAGSLFYLALARDITERTAAEDSLRQSEAYLTESQRLSHTGSWALDVTSNRYLYTSEEFDRLFGFEPQGEAPTREAVLERMHPDDWSIWKRDLEKSLRNKVDTSTEYRILLPDGRIRHIHTIRHPVVNSAGEVVKLVGTSIDITERKHADEEHSTQSAGQ